MCTKVSTKLSCIYFLRNNILLLAGVRVPRHGDLGQAGDLGQPAGLDQPRGAAHHQPHPARHRGQQEEGQEEGQEDEEAEEEEEDARAARGGGCRGR